MCIVATVCIIGADTNLNNISVIHIAVRYMGIGQIRRHIGDANLAGNN